MLLVAITFPSLQIIFMQLDTEWHKYCILEMWIYAFYYINVRKGKIQTALSKQSEQAFYIKWQEMLS